MTFSKRHNNRHIGNAMVIGHASSIECSWKTVGVHHTNNRLFAWISRIDLMDTYASLYIIYQGLSDYRDQNTNLITPVIRHNMYVVILCFGTDD